MSTPAQQKLIEAQQKLYEIRQKRIDAEQTAAMEKDRGPPGLSLAEYRKTPKGQREYNNWANKKAPADGKPDFGGRKRRSRKTRRGRKSRSTRRR